MSKTLNSKTNSMCNLKNSSTCPVCSIRYRKTTSSRFARIALCNGNKDFALIMLYRVDAAIDTKSSAVRSSYK